MRSFYLAAILLYSLTVYSQNTALKLYRPFDFSEGQAQTKVNRKLEGKCPGQSILLKRENTWYCIANGVTYDPCFTKQSGMQKEALCPLSPWSSSAAIISVSEPLNEKTHIPLDMSTAYPWAIELKNGIRCMAIKSNQLFDNLHYRYQCTDNSFLIGHLQRCAPDWKVLRKKDSKIKTETIATVWF